jgi:hypothetical protein
MISRRNRPMKGGYVESRGREEKRSVWRSCGHLRMLGGAAIFERNEAIVVVGRSTSPPYPDRVVYII